MSEPGFDLEKPNAIGVLDRLTTNFALSTIAVFPTFWAAIVTPWRLAKLLNLDDPNGRSGLLLAPGAFFPLSLLVSFIIAATFTTPEILNINGAFIGPELALSVRSAASDGDVWKIVATIMPIYGVAVVFGLLASFLKPWAGQDWTLRVSLRASFYVNAVLVSWLILTGTAVDWLRIASGNSQIGNTIYPVLVPLTCGWILWVYFWFFRDGGAISWVRSGLLSAAMFGMLFGLIVGIDLLIRF